MKRENRKTRKMTTWINIVHSLASGDTIKHFVCERGSGKLAGNIPTSLAGWVQSTDTGNNPPRESKQCSLTKYTWKRILTPALPASLQMTPLMVGLIWDLYGQQMDSLLFEMAHRQTQTVSGQRRRPVGRKQLSHSHRNVWIRHFVHCSSICMSAATEKPPPTFTWTQIIRIKGSIRVKMAQMNMLIGRVRSDPVYLERNFIPKERGRWFTPIIILNGVHVSSQSDPASLVGETFSTLCMCARSAWHVSTSAASGRFSIKQKILTL